MDGEGGGGRSASVCVCGGAFRSYQILQSQIRVLLQEQPGLEFIKKFLLNLAEHEIFPAHKC